jgi:hypothetical protein
MLFSSENGLLVGGLLQRQGRKRIKELALANANAAKRPVYLAEVTRLLDGLVRAKQLPLLDSTLT